MDFFRESSANLTTRISPNEFDVSTSEDRETHKRWAKAALAFYGCLFLFGAIAISIHQSVTTSTGTEQHANARVAVPFRP